MNTSSGNFDAVLFDMDGTLWNAVPTYARAWNAYFLKENQSRRVDSDLLRSLMGMEEQVVLEKMLPHLQEVQRTFVYRNEVIPLIYEFALREGGQLYDGVTHGLKQLANFYKLFIVSNCPENLIGIFIQWAGYKSLITDSLAYGSNLKSKKENMLLLKELHGLKRPVYVGDTHSDYLQCRAAEIPFIYVDYGFGYANKFFKKFSNFAEVSDFLILHSSQPL